MRWLKCIAKLIGRTIAACATIGIVYLLLRAAFDILFACVFAFKEVLAVLAFFFCLLMFLVAVGTVLWSVCTFIHWSFTPPLLDPPKEK